MFVKHLRVSLALTFLMMIITGIVYPAIVTALAQLVFPAQAEGSLVSQGGHVIGSSLIAQRFEKPWYFHSRPSAAGDGYDATSSGGTNKGPTDRKLADTLVAREVAKAEMDGGVDGRIPGDMVTASASGLDPHISPANAQIQVQRIARSRGIDPVNLEQLVLVHTEARQFGFLGEPRINVLELNLALDREFPSQSHLR